MKLNPYSVALILLFSIIVWVSSKTIDIQDYQQNTPDTCLNLTDSFNF